MKKIFSIFGPTGIGKSSLAIELAKKIDGEIIGVDSRQIYNGIPIGTAQPNPSQLEEVPPHLIGFKKLSERISAGEYIELIDSKIDEITQKNKFPILCGGTGLYFKSLKEGIFEGSHTNENIRSHVKINQLNLTQGFIASDKNNFNVTLGREGSDYSAAVFAYAINADSLTIWKDVEGLLNGDPKYFKNTKLIKNISYSEAIELAFYGASVIHPKTLQPVQKKEIPLYVKSFEKPNQKGTEINKNLDLSPKVPCYIFKNNMKGTKIFKMDFFIF